MVGGGVMGEAILSRLLAQQIYLPEQILVSEPQLQRREFLAQRYGIEVVVENQKVAAAATVLFLAIKPQVFETVAIGLMSHRTSAHVPLIISILAGVPLSRLEATFPNQPVVRAMPNTPATVGAGITAISPGKYTQPPHLEQSHRIFGAVGEVVEVPESLMDAVTGLSGSGPGYVALAIEALTDGGVAAGLPRSIAAKLALQTVRGTALLLQESGMHPAELKDRVTSPGGTTIAGIAHLEKSAFRSALITAVQVACQRSQELGQS